MVTENKSGTTNFWFGYFFQASSFYGDIFFEKKTSLFVYKSLLPSLTFVNREVHDIADGFLHNLCLSFDITFTKLGVISKKVNMNL